MAACIACHGHGQGPLQVTAPCDICKEHYIMPSLVYLVVDDVGVGLVLQQSCDCI